MSEYVSEYVGFACSDADDIVFSHDVTLCG